MRHSQDKAGIIQMTALFADILRTCACTIHHRQLNGTQKVSLMSSLIKLYHKYRLVTAGRQRGEYSAFVFPSTRSQGRTPWWGIPNALYAEMQWFTIWCIHFVCWPLGDISTVRIYFPLLFYPQMVGYPPLAIHQFQIRNQNKQWNNKPIYWYTHRYTHIQNFC